VRVIHKDVLFELGVQIRQINVNMGRKQSHLAIVARRTRRVSYLPVVIKAFLLLEATGYPAGFES
jgi:hypothetical protein